MTVAVAEVFERVVAAVERAGHINDAGRKRYVTVLTSDAVSLVALPEALIRALADVDLADQKCPVRHPSTWLTSWIDRERCPKCGATADQNCGPEVSAQANLVAAVRGALGSEPKMMAESEQS